MLGDNNNNREAAKALIRDFVKLQREKYGDDWKEILAKEMSKKMTPMVSALLSLRNDDKKDGG